MDVLNAKKRTKLSFQKQKRAYDSAVSEEKMKLSNEQLNEQLEIFKGKSRFWCLTSSKVPDTCFADLCIKDQYLAFFVELFAYSSHAPLLFRQNPTHPLPTHPLPPLLSLPALAPSPHFRTPHASYKLFFQ